MTRTHLEPVKYTLPAYWASYLINGDASGLEPAEKAAADKFLADHSLPAPVDCGESYFAKSNDAGTLAGDVMEYTFLKENSVTTNEPVRHKLAVMPEQGERLRFALVYQAGLANVFRVDCSNAGTYGRNAIRVYQGDFRTAEAIAHGCGIAGAIVHTNACNKAGDIEKETWSMDLDSQPFSEQFRPVFYTIGR